MPTDKDHGDLPFKSPTKRSNKISDRVKMFENSASGSKSSSKGGQHQPGDLLDSMFSPEPGTPKPKVGSGLVKKMQAAALDADKDEHNSSHGSLNSSLKFQKEKELILQARYGSVKVIAGKFDDQVLQNLEWFQRLLEQKKQKKSRYYSKFKKRPRSAAASGKKTDAKHHRSVWTNKWAQTSFQVDPKTYKAPKNLKSPTKAQDSCLRKAIKENVLFREEATEPLIQAFELVHLAKGETLDDKENFYVVEEGHIEVKVDGKTVGTAKAGDTFGDLNLLYSQKSSPKSKGPTFVATEDTKVLRLNNKDYRGIVQCQAKQDDQDKSDALKKLPFMKKLAGNEKNIAKISSIMKPIHFKAGEKLPSSDGEPLYIVKDGKLKLTSDKNQQFVLGPGDHIGRKALTGSRGKEPNVTDIEALTDGVAYTIDKGVADKVLGKNFLTRQASRMDDKAKLAGFECIRSVDLDSKTLDVLAEAVDDKTFESGTQVFEQGAQVEPCLYLVREGKVMISSNDGSLQREIGPGGYFGVEQLLVPKETFKQTPEEMKNLTLPAEWNVTVLGDEPCVMGVLSLIDSQAIINSDGKPEEVAVADHKESPVFEELEQRREEVETKVTLDDLEMISVLGDGAFGEVWLVSTEVFGKKEKFALKSVKKSADVVASIKREIDFMKVMRHPFMCDMVSTFDTDTNIYMLLGLLPGGELWDVIHREDDDHNWISGIPESQAKFYGLLIADTLAYIHSKQYVYRDLKPENVMIDAQGYPIVIDFGFTKHCTEKTFTSCGTPNYVAPEIVWNCGHDRGADYWALGILMYEMVSGEHPFYMEGMDQMMVFQAITSEKAYPLPDTVSKDMVEFVDGLLEKESAQRLGMLNGGSKDIIKHKCFQEMNLADLRSKKVKAPWIPQKSK